MLPCESGLRVDCMSFLFVIDVRELLPRFETALDTSISDQIADAADVFLHLHFDSVFGFMDVFE